jgi:hypothetical protein
VVVDGQPVETSKGGGGSALSVPAHARELEVRGAAGTLWATRLEPGAGDTVRAVLTGEIVVECAPQAPQGRLFVDGAAVGTAPGTVSGVAPGWHHVEIRDAETVLFETSCTVVAGQVAMIPVPRAPGRSRGKLTVRARILSESGFRDVSGYPVRIDGGRAGETPLEITVRGGVHSVRVDAPGRPYRVEVLAIEGGTSRYVDAEFGSEEHLEVRALAPDRGRRGAPLAVPVRVVAPGAKAPLARAWVRLLREGQGEPVEIPLIPSGTDPQLYVAGIPESMTGSRVLLGYASCQDELGRRGDSELFAVELTR